MKRETMYACKETAECLRVMIHRKAHFFTDFEYEQLYCFLKACVKGLPKRETLLRDLEAKRTGRKLSTIK